MSDPITTPAGRVLPFIGPVAKYDAWQDHKWRILHDGTTGQARVMFVPLALGSLTYPDLDAALVAIDMADADASEHDNPFTEEVADDD